MYFSVGEEEDEFSDGRILQGENFPWRGKFPRDELFKGSFTLGEFTRIPIRNFFICLAFSLPIQF